MILDAKRGDIGSTAEQYAVEAFDRFGADAVTLNPYMGRDSAAPFLARRPRLRVPVPHLQPGARDFQELDVGGEFLYQRIARTIANEWNADGNCALVVGATFLQELKAIRGIVGDMPLLIPRRRRAGRRCRGGGQERQDRRRHRADDQLLARDPVRLERRGLRRCRGQRGRILRDEINRYR